MSELLTVEYWVRSSPFEIMEIGAPFLTKLVEFIIEPLHSPLNATEATFDLTQPPFEPVKTRASAQSHP